MSHTPGDFGLAEVYPGVLASLGVDPVTRDGRRLGASWAPPPATSAVVVLVDGLGWELLRARAGHARRLLRSMLADGTSMAAGFPSTTATSLASLGTGLTPGEHGLLGYCVLDPGSGRLLNELSWEDGPPPERWQPRTTMLEHARASGVQPYHVGKALFDGSGLTRSALRGGTFLAAETLRERVDRTLATVRREPRCVVLLYWEGLDRVGHEQGCSSVAWTDELEAVDAELARLRDGLPRHTSLTVTGDHGMVDIPLDARLDLAADAELAAGVAGFGGEPRCPQLYTRPGAADDVLATWRARLSGSALVLSRAEAVQQGWFGRVAPEHEARIGDVVVAMVDGAVVDSRVMRPVALSLVGQHGSISDAERLVPLLHAPAAAST